MLVFKLKTRNLIAKMICQPSSKNGSILKFLSKIINFSHRKKGNWKDNSSSVDLGTSLHYIGYSILALLSGE